MNNNFIPTAPNFKTLVRMSFQGLTNFPYIEEDFDALTNYGLLSKVVEYLNQVISNNNEQNDTITKLYNSYLALYNYITDYFDNLDVQEEIDNKLEQMVEDGTLSQYLNSIVETKINTDINPIITNQNAKINEIYDKVDAATSGSPKGAYATVAALTTADPNHDYIYVVIADGKWYYYDTTNSQWTAGGIYQSSVEDTFFEDVEGAYNDCVIKNVTKNIFTTTELDTVNNKIFSTANGQLSSSDYQGYVAYTNYIEIEEGEQYYVALYSKETGNFYSLGPSIVCFYKSDNTFISAIQLLIDNQPVTAPVGAKYLRISINSTSYLTNNDLLICKAPYPATYSAYHETYYTIDPNSIAGNSDIDIKYHDIVVDANGSGDYTTLQGAFSYITSQNDNTYYNRYNVYIKQGQYNLGANLQPSDYDNPSVHGVFVPNYTNLIGVGNKKDVVLYLTCETKQQYISTLNLAGTCGLENLSVIGTKTRYTIHADTTQTSEYHHTIKNCIIKGINTYFSVVYGSGSYDNAHWEFIDTIFDGTTTGNNETNGVPFTVHNSLNSHANRFIKFENCRFLTHSANKQAAYFKSMIQRPNTTDSTNSFNNMQTYVEIYGCEFGDNGFSLLEENPTYYGSGCAYFVSGYGNKNDSYVINTTDGLDYSDRVNLI